MALSIDHINKINREAIAVSGRRYTSEKGDVYIGLANGKLRPIDKKSLKNERDISKNKEVIDETVDALTLRVSDNETELTRLETVKIDLCKSVAMSVMLG